VKAPTEGGLTIKIEVDMSDICVKCGHKYVRFNGERICPSCGHTAGYKKFDIVSIIRRNDELERENERLRDEIARISSGKDGRRKH
jgi:uncharacterized Zn finger protein (UPF0148 family)